MNRNEKPFAHGIVPFRRRKSLSRTFAEAISQTFNLAATHCLGATRPNAVARALLGVGLRAMDQEKGWNNTPIVIVAAKAGVQFKAALSAGS